MTLDRGSVIKASDAYVTGNFCMVATKNGDYVPYIMADRIIHALGELRVPSSAINRGIVEANLRVVAAINRKAVPGLTLDRVGR